MYMGVDEPHLAAPPAPMAEDTMGWHEAVYAPLSAPASALCFDRTTGRLWCGLSSVRAWFGSALCVGVGVWVCGAEDGGTPHHTPCVCVCVRVRVLCFLLSRGVCRVTLLRLSSRTSQFELPVPHTTVLSLTCFLHPCACSRCKW